MNTHPYFRAYLAGVAPPSILYFAGVGTAACAALVRQMPVEFPPLAIFPVAIVPGVWGLWNMLHLRLRPRWTLGLHGAVLPLLLAPAAFSVLRAFGIVWLTPWMLALGIPVGAVLYYFVWKYVVGWCNRALDIG